MPSDTILINTMRMRDFIIRRTIFNACVKVYPLLNCCIIVLSNLCCTHGDLSWPQAFCDTSNWRHRNYETRSIVQGWLQGEREFNFTMIIRYERDDLQKIARWPTDNPTCKAVSKCDKYCLFLIQSKFEFSYSAISKKHINAIGHSYTIAINMHCASGVFYVY